MITLGMYCKECGKQVEDDSKFCCKCGAAQVGDAPKEQSFSHSSNSSGSNATPPKSPPKENVVAVMGLIFAFIFSPAGIIISAFGLSEAKKMNGEGRELALAGLIVSIALTILEIISLILVFIFVSRATEWLMRLINAFL
jgi:hypothetical protein